MTPDRRQGRYTVLPRSGALLNEDAYRDWVGAIDRRAPKRARVERLSTSDPAIVAFEQTSRERVA